MSPESFFFSSSYLSIILFEIKNKTESEEN